MRDLPPGHAHQLVLRIAEDLAQAAVDADELAVEADVRHARARQLEGAPVALLALPQRLLRAPALGHVVEYRHLVERLAGRAARERHREAHPDGGAVAAQVA